jgi:hypothetical protein
MSHEQRNLSDKLKLELICNIIDITHTICISYLISSTVLTPPLEQAFNQTQ